MLRSATLLLLSVLTGQGFAQSDAILLSKYPKLLEFYLYTETRDCMSAIIDLSIADLGMQGKNSDSARRGVTTCIQETQSSARATLVAALGTLAERPKTSEAVKTYYMKWAARIESEVPNYGEKFNSPQHKKRMEEASRDLTASKRAMILELQLGM